MVRWLEGVLQPDWCATQLGCLLPSASLAILDAMCFREETSTDVTAVCLIEQEWSNSQERQGGMRCPLISQSSVGQSAARFESCPWSWLAVPNQSSPYQIDSAQLRLAGTTSNRCQSQLLRETPTEPQTHSKSSNSHTTVIASRTSCSASQATTKNNRIAFLGTAAVLQA